MVGLDRMTMVHPWSLLSVVRGAGTHVSRGDSLHSRQPKVTVRQDHGLPPSPAPCFSPGGGPGREGCGRPLQRRQCRAQILGSQVPMAQLVPAAGLEAALFELKSRRGHS